MIFMDFNIYNLVWICCEVSICLDILLYALHSIACSQWRKQRGPSPRTLQTKHKHLRLNCAKFANLVSLFFGKIIRIIVATRSKAKMLQIRFRPGLYAPDPAGGAHSAFPGPPARF